MKKIPPDTPKKEVRSSMQKSFFEKTFVWRAFLPVIIWTIAILALSISPGIQLPDAGISTDKLAHFAAYGLLGWLVLRALHKTNKLTTKLARASVAWVAAYGASLEVVQWAFFPNRFFEIGDMIANTAGAVFSYFAFNFFTKN